MGRSTSEGNMQGLRKKGKQITIQSISPTMTLEGNMKEDTAKGKMGTNTLKGDIHEMGKKQTHITFYGNKSFKCLIQCTVKSFMQQFL